MSIEDDCSITFVQFPCRFRIRTDAPLYPAPGAFRLRRLLHGVRPFDIGAIVVASEDVAVGIGIAKSISGRAVGKRCWIAEEIDTLPAMLELPE